jgi:hypothetical protein
MLRDYIPRSQLELRKGAKPDEEELSDDELRAILGEGGIADHKERDSDKSLAMTTDEEDDPYA